MKIPLLYPILDVDSLSAGCEQGKLLQSVCAHSLALAEAGCTLLQYRAKRLDMRSALAQARELRRLLPGVTLIMNDRADLCLAAGFDGVHIGQEDLSPEGARSVVGAKAIVGLSTHNPIQMTEALTKPWIIWRSVPSLQPAASRMPIRWWAWLECPRPVDCGMTRVEHFHWWQLAESREPTW